MQDPTDLIGDDVLEPEVNLYGADFDETMIEERLKHLHNLYGNNTGGWVSMIYLKFLDS